ncbi:MAG: HD domain-containing protein [Bacteroidales bacterium]|nr:HD domain-containing protein [Bacteroidales bacterium]
MEKDTKKDFFIGLRKWFVDYAESFCDLVDEPEMIRMKINHSLRVLNEIRELSDELYLTDYDVNLAEIMALLHDVGRFRQFYEYKTFSDKQSIDHAELGLTVIRENDLLAKLSTSHREMVYQAIANHNKARIDENLTGKSLFFARLLRDADKLDIFKVVIAHYQSDQSNSTLELNLSNDNRISENVSNAILNKKMVDLYSIQTLSDFKVLQISWVYDINFALAFARIHKRGYLRSIAETMNGHLLVVPMLEQLERFCKENMHG